MASATPIIDVAHPGKALPPDSAKPIMVTNRPIMQDPMMAQATDTEATSGAPLLETTLHDHVTKLPPSQKKKHIMPTSTTTSIEVKTTPAVTPATDEKVVAAADSIPDSETVPALPEAAAPTADEPAESTAVKKPDEADESAGDVVPVANEKELAAAAAQANKVAELIKGERYVLPINAVERRRSKQVVIGGFLLIIILAMAWFDLAADAGFIHLPGLPLTHFFRV
jgi:hypothetical protein